MHYGNVLSDPPHGGVGGGGCTMAPSNGPIHGKMDDGNGLTASTLGKKKKEDDIGR